MRVEIIETRRKIIEFDDCTDIENAVLEKYKLNHKNTFKR